MARKILIVTDAGWQLGTGHLVRCMTLGDALENRGFSIHWMVSNQARTLMSRITNVATIHTSDLSSKAIFDCIRTVEPQWLIIDRPGHALEDPHLHKLRHMHVMVMGDLGDSSASADIVWNGNVGAEELTRSRLSSQTSYLAGGQFALVDPAFCTERVDFREQGVNVLLTFGGSDPGGFTLRVLQSLQYPLPFARLTVLVGSLNQQRIEIQNAAARLPTITEVVVNATDVAKRASQADVAIISGGITTYEFMASGLPSLFLPFGPPQRFFLERIEKRGFGEMVTLSQIGERLCSLVADPVRRRTMARVGRSLVDGQGADRVAAVLDSWSAYRGT